VKQFELFASKPLKKDSILRDKAPEIPEVTIGQLKKTLSKLVRVKKDLHPVVPSMGSRKRKRAAFEALHRMESVELDRKDGLMSPVKPKPEPQDSSATKKLKF
jgi:hypothetical protein